MTKATHDGIYLLNGYRHRMKAGATLPEGAVPVTDDEPAPASAKAKSGKSGKTKDTGAGPQEKTESQGPAENTEGQAPDSGEATGPAEDTTAAGPQETT